MNMKIRVMLLLDEGHTRDSARIILSMAEGVILGGETDDIVQYYETAKDFKPDVTIVGEEVKGRDGFSLSKDIIDHDPLQSVIFVASRLNVETYKNALYTGIREVLKAPLHPQELKDAVDRAYGAREKVGQSVFNNGFANGTNNIQEPVEEIQEDVGKARIISVFSIKGGVGKTTISTNLSAALAEEGKKTALLDFDIYSGDVSLAMDVIPKRRAADLSNDINRLDMDLLESYMVKHSSGVMVFTAPFNIEHADFIKADHIEKILSILKQEYDFIVVDCPSYFYDIAMLALRNSDTILLVATMDILSLKSIKNTISVLEDVEVDRAKMTLVLNKYISRVGLTPSDIEATLSLPITSVIPLDSQSVLSSMNQGVPFVTGMKRSKVAKSLQSLAKGILAKAGGGE